LRIGAPPRIDLQRLADVHRRDVDLLPHNRGADFGASLERHVRELHACGALEHEHQEVVRRSLRPSSDGQLAGIRARPGGELLQVFTGVSAVHGEVARVVDDVAQQLEALRAAEDRLALDRDRHQRGVLMKPMV